MNSKKKNRWGTPPPSWQQRPPPQPLFPPWQPPFHPQLFNNVIWFDRNGEQQSSTGNKGSVATPPLPGTEEENASSNCTASRSQPRENQRYKNDNPPFDRKDSRERPAKTNTKNFDARNSGLPLRFSSSSYHLNRRKNTNIPFAKQGNPNFAYRPSHWQKGRAPLNPRAPLSARREYGDQFYEDIPLVLSGDSNWVEPEQVQHETRSEKKQNTKKRSDNGDDKTPMLGSEEERRQNVKATTEWLKNVMSKKKDHSQFDNLLKEKSRQKATEPPPKNNGPRKDSVPCVPIATDNSALEASSIETVKKNLSDVLPDETNLLNSLLKDCGMEEETNGMRKTGMSLSDKSPKERIEEAAPAPRQPAAKTRTNFNTVHTDDTPDCILSKSSTFTKPNYTVRSRQTSECSSSSISKDETRGSTISAQKEDILQWVRKVCPVSNIGQLKDLMMNPRPGRFEYHLRELMKKHQKQSCQGVRLSEEPFSGTEEVEGNVKREIESDEDFISSLEEFTAVCSVEMEDLPCDFAQRLLDMLKPDFSEETPVEEVADVEQDSPVRIDEPPTTYSRPGIRIRDFARLREETGGPTRETDTIVSVSRPTVPSRQEDDNSAVKNDSKSCAEEADTTINIPHPLDGPNLMATIKATPAVFPPRTPTNNVGRNTAECVSASSPRLSRGTTVQKGRRTIIQQEVFHSGENCGKTGKKCAKSPIQKPRKKSFEKVRPLVGTDSDTCNSNVQSKHATMPSASKSPDSTVLYGAEQAKENPQIRASSHCKSAPASANSSLLETSDDDQENSLLRGSSKSLDEPQIFARLIEICGKIDNLKKELEKLEKEKADLYSLLPVPSAKQGETNTKRKRRASLSGSDDESAIRREIMAGVRADLLSAPTSSVREDSTKKKKLKKSRPVTNFEKKVASPISPAKVQKKTRVGTLLFFTENVTLTCDKQSLPKDIGIITQIKVIRKLILASSTDGKVYAINSSTGKVKRTFKGGAFPVKCFVLAETNGLEPEVRIFFGTENGHLHSFGLLSGEKIHQSIPVSNDIQCLDAKWGFVYIGTKGGCIMKYDIQTMKLNTNAVSSENGVIMSINCTNEGPRRVLIVACERNGVEIRDALNGLLLRPVIVGGDLLALGYSNYQYLVDVYLDRVFCSKLGEVHVYEYSRCDAMVNKYKVSTHISCMCVSKGILYIGCKDGSIRRFDVKTDRHIGSLTGNRENVVCMDVVDDKVIVARRGGFLEVISLLNGIGDSESLVS